MSENQASASANPVTPPISWRFRCRFYVTEPGCFATDAGSMDFVLPDGQRATLQTVMDTPLRSTNEWILIGKACETEAWAWAAGRRARAALQVLGVEVGLGIDLGNDRPTAGVGAEYRARVLEQFGEDIISDVHGLSVYPEYPPPRLPPRLAGNLEVHVPNPPAFEVAFSAAYLRAPELDSKESLAFALYAASHFEPGARNRFLLLVMAVECLLSPLPRPDGSQAMLKEFIERVSASELPEGEAESLVRSLKFLSKDSILSTGRRLVADLLGGKTYSVSGNQRPLRADRYWTYCYGIRSQVLHDGQADDPTVSLDQLAGDVGVFVRDLLLAVAERRRGETTPRSPTATPATG